MLFSLFGTFSFSASAETYSGTWGNLTWTLDAETGELVISGEGEMHELSSTDAWRNYQNIIKSVVIGDGITSIGNDAFSGCSSLTSIDIPNSVTSIGNFAFSRCSSLTNITIPDGVTSIGDSAFTNCSSLASITIPDGVTSIEYSVFSGCSSLASITIPNSATSIGAYAFRNCSSLTSITIPDSVTSIEYYAFKSCNSLTSVNYHGSESDWSEMTIYSNNSYLLNATRNYIYGSETFNSASVRISADHPGIRFKTAIEQSVLDELIAQYGKENIRIGTIIIPADMVTELDMVTVAALDAAGISYVSVWADIDTPFMTNGTTNIYAGSLVNIKEANLDRDFIGVGYIEITKGDGEVIHYYSSTTAKRNISYVASRAIEDTSETKNENYKYEIVVDNKVCYSPYSDAHREILGKLIVKK